ncbi:hypothetical protein NQ036_03825 [Brevibacterium sp. 91QC2O2]|uniref:hypothetical protein n=1 Tax=Brevibacterium TaxID=1696 RepID=UPI00211C84FD|nr:MULTISPECIES: hypothetical protein [unclassified Brevibacterium]MCQ9367376.1 hypothetical protein [Brevibacterium sp. 91QC2O2]MCQ9384611.1 hypothetical protein [Brevibacterium sp. 68QC2CO]
MESLLNQMLNDAQTEQAAQARARRRMRAKHERRRFFLLYTPPALALSAGYLVAVVHDNVSGQMGALAGVAILALAALLIEDRCH